MCTVITSLNPRIKRFDLTGNDYGIEYQKKCLNSWLDAGARVVSINTDDEIRELTALKYNANFVRVHAKSFMPGGRAVPSISDALEVAKQCHSGMVLITNSDIFFSADAKRLNYIKNLVKKNTFLFASRLDIKSVGAKVGTLYDQGYDVFAFDASKAWGFDTSVFTFGAPWWDYWLPVNALFNGLDLKFLESKDFHHVSHENAWDWASWNFGFCVFVNKARSQMNKTDAIMSPKDFGSEFSRFLFEIFAEAVQDPSNLISSEPIGIGMTMGTFVRKVVRGASRRIA